MQLSRRAPAASLILVVVLLLSAAALAGGSRTSGASDPAAGSQGGAQGQEGAQGEELPEPDLRRAVPIALAHRSSAAAGIPLPVAEEGEPPEPYVTGPRPGSPEVIPPPPLRTGTGALYAVGDSVLLGAEPYLRTTLDGWDVRLDGRVSRGVPEGFELVRMNRDRIGDVLVLVLGHNYGGGGHFPGWLEAVLDRTDHVQRVVLVTVTEWSPAQREVNRAIRRAPANHPNVVVADWAAVVEANPQFLRDHVHTSRTGAMALANLIAVMTGPAPSRDGVTPPRPHLLPVPDEPVYRVPPSTTATSRPGTGSTTTTIRSGGGTTSTTAATTTSTTAGSSTTSVATTTTIEVQEPPPEEDGDGSAPGP